MFSTIAAYLFGFAVLISVLFQLALAAGIPWGHLAMGGRFPGVFPPAMRVGAVIQAGILTFLGGVVLARAGVAFPGLAESSRALIWAAVAISGLSTAMNLATPSPWERRIWTPVAVVMTLCSLIVAFS